MKASIATTGFIALSDWEKAFAMGTHDQTVGKVWKGWKKGQFQVHFIYTGVAESMFLIFPDGTTMLLDCGDHNAIGRGALAVPVLPNPERHSGEWIARYVLRVNPHGKDVDYMMLSHYHNDHAGDRDFFASEEVRDGQPYHLSGFSQAAEFLHFGKAFDRLWPDYNDPLPMAEDSESTAHMRQFYTWMQAHEGLEIEKFEVGAIDQVKMLHKPGKYSDFSIRNICGNGRIATKDGKIINLYEERKKKGEKEFNENGMSIGMIISYGPFRYFTAGDFSDGWDLKDGRHFEIEDALGDVVEHCHVAKINHHGYYSMYPNLVRNLKSRVYVSCVWDQLHDMPDTLRRVCDRSLYPGERIVCPGIMPKERREKDGAEAWMNDVSEASFDGGHVVLTVEPGGKDYSITYLTAADESMTVRSVMKFKTEE